MLACLIIGFVIGMWLGYRIGAKLGILTALNDIVDKLRK
jgi:membrane protein DedA with SNARE-associated domain